MSDGSTIPPEAEANGGLGAYPVRVAVVGLGYWGPNLVRNLHELPEAELVAVCDRDERALGRVRRRYPGVRQETDFDALLRDPAVEAIALATPVATHHPLARRALESGKHVFVEKPLASSVDGAADLVRLGRERGLSVMAGHTFLYSPAVNLIRQHIDEGVIGTPYFISMSRVNLGLHQNDVSVVWDLGPHDFSILRYWLDESPVMVSAIGRSCVIPGRDDVAFVNLEFASGAIAHVELSWLAPSKLRRTTIVGSEKMIVYDDTSAEPVRVFDSGVQHRPPETFGEFQLSYRTGDIVSPRLEVVEPLLHEMLDFCRSVRGMGAPRSSGVFGLEIVRVIEAVDRSLERGGEPVLLADEVPVPIRAAQ
jgi:predicted dehydrogenase